MVTTFTSKGWWRLLATAVVVTLIFATSSGWFWKLARQQTFDFNSLSLDPLYHTTPAIQHLAQGDGYSESIQANTTGINLDLTRSLPKAFLIRHGEKNGGGQIGLSPEGKRRTKCIRKIFSKGDKKVDYIIAPDFFKDGRRKRSYDSVKPLADELGISVDHHCDRNDAKCVGKVVRRELGKGNNVLICWQHETLGNVAEELGVQGIMYPNDRFDILYSLRFRTNYLKDGLAIDRVDSENCTGLD